MRITAAEKEDTRERIIAAAVDHRVHDDVCGTQEAADLKTGHRGLKLGAARQAQGTDLGDKPFSVSSFLLGQ